MSDVVIQVNDVSKLYRLGEVGTGTISHDLNRWWASLRGKEDPFSKVGQVNDRTKKANENEHVWALQDINFEVKQGEVLGVIGKNGAGKSTLLKLLSRITAPTTGEIKIKGRVASLLEVGTGMHPEMTGVENVYLNGTILGMRKLEIKNKLEEILDFAGCLKYADTPVKRYSSGMKVRLGFAVAAFLEPEVLIVDEVLAVGDAEFQKKAIGKMKEISSGEGRTVLFVSHNLGSVGNLCTSSIIIENGTIVYSGPVQDAIKVYTSNTMQELRQCVRIDESYRKNSYTKKLEFTEIELINTLHVATDEPLIFRIRLKKNVESVKEFRIIGMINNVDNNRVGLFFSNPVAYESAASKIECELILNDHNLAKGKYSLDFNVGLGDNTTTITDFDIVYNTISFEIMYDSFSKRNFIAKWNSNWGNSCYKNVSLKIKP